MNRDNMIELPHEWSSTGQISVPAPIVNKLVKAFDCMPDVVDALGDIDAHNYYGGEDGEKGVRLRWEIADLRPTEEDDLMSLYAEVEVWWNWAGRGHDLECALFCFDHGIHEPMYLSTLAAVYKGKRDWRTFIQEYDLPEDFR